MNRDSTAGKRRWPAVLLFCTAAVLFVFLSLPLFVEHIILPPLLAKIGFSNYQVEVSRFGPAGASLHLTAYDIDAAVTSGTVRIEWTIPGLLKHRLDQVVLTGFLVDLPLPLHNQKPVAADSSQSTSFELPVIVEDIRILNSTVLLRANGRVLTLPVSLSGQLQEKPEGSGPKSPRYLVELTVGQQVLTADFSLDSEEARLDGSLEANLPLDALGALLPQSLPITMFKGTVDLAGGLRLVLAPFRVESLEAGLDFNELWVDGNGLELKAMEAEKPHVTLTGGDGQYEITGSGFALTRPLRSTLNFSASLTQADDKFGWRGSLIARPAPAQQLGAAWVLEKAPELELQYSGEEGRVMQVSLQSKNDAGKGHASFTFRNEKRVMRLDSLAVEAHPGKDSQGTDPGPEIDYSILGMALQLDAGDMQLTFPEVGLVGRAAVPPVTDPAKWPVTGSLRLAAGSLDLQEQGVRLEGIQLSLPYSWPERHAPVGGDFRIGSFEHQDAQLGSFSGQVAQVGQGLSLQGGLQTVLVPDTPIRLEGSVEIGPRVQLAYDMQNGIVSMANIAALDPKLSAISGSAQLDLQGSVRFDSCGLDGEMSARLSDGNFAMPDAHLALENVRLDIHVPRLQHFATDPAQEMSIGTLRSNKVAVNDIQVLFRLESPQSLLIERLSGNWAGGRIFSSSFRLRKDLQKLELALFCDRLELSQILSQFKLADAGGQGRLSGRVPLFYENGKFFVDDGFLFTSPGEQGILRIKKSEYLAVDVPTDVPQFSPLHFAGAALRDFEYNWAKLNIYSEEENLLLKLQIDGRPGERLPYRFDPASNAFVRLKDDGAAGMDQPVKLDVNFKVPVNKLFRYQKSIMPLLRNLK